VKVFGALHLFCGIGGGALGMQDARGEYRGLPGGFRTLAGIDVDPEACRDFARITGASAACLDLFSREDFAAFHGREYLELPWNVPIHP
jgi:site-specific DNA-cytosine methylase